jgi:hypothetical protein
MCNIVHLLLIIDDYRPPEQVDVDKPPVVIVPLLELVEAAVVVDTDMHCIPPNVKYEVRS